MSSPDLTIKVWNLTIIDFENEDLDVHETFFTKAGARKRLATYARENWWNVFDETYDEDDEEARDEHEMPALDSEVIEKFYASASDNSNIYYWLDEQEVKD